MKDTELFNNSREKLRTLKDVSLIDSDELSLLEWYVYETDSLHKDMYEKEVSYISGQDIESESYNDSGLIAISYFLKRTRYSHVIYLASLGERVLNDSCDKLADVLGENLIFNLQELSGKTWTKERKFLERYGNFVIPDKIWNNFSAIYVIRNVLVHENGKVNALFDNERELLRKKYSSMNGIDVEGNEIVIERIFIEDSIKAVNVIIQFLDEKLGEIIERSIKPKLV